MSKIQSEAFRHGVATAQSGYMMASHYRKKDQIADYEAGWMSVCKTHTAISISQGTNSIIHVGSERECEDAAKSYKARYPSVKVAVKEAKK